ncbi:MAG: hypothetical protein GXO50_09040, partial [Chlorobi bacterium]|nr:hypothetical protein [Chlorobiota bacterium]
MRKSVRKPIFTVLKIIFTGISLIFIFFKLKDYPLSDFYVTGLSFKDSAVFITVILLMPVNWFAESVKWRFLMRNIHKISLKTAFRAVMIGLPFAMITPNRSGEFIGRIINMPPENRGKSAVAATVGSISQMLITVIAGVIAGILLLFFYPEKKTGLNPEELNYLKIFSVSILFFGVLFLFNLKYLYLFFKKIKPGAKITSYFEILETYDTKELFRILFFSLLRYAVFSLQFFLLLYFYKTQITFADAFT